MTEKEQLAHFAQVANETKIFTSTAVDSIEGVATDEARKIGNQVRRLVFTQLCRMHGLQHEDAAGALSFDSM